MSDFIEPRLLSQHDYESFTSAWELLVKGTPSPDGLTLGQVFAARDQEAPNPIVNYVYLSNKYAVALLSAVGTVAIQIKFAVVSPTFQPAFSIVIYGVDKDNQPTSAYYLAGVAADPATVQVVVGPTPDSPPELVGLDLAGNWIQNWQNLEANGVSLDASVFTSVYGPLLGYTYPLDDFLQALFPAGLNLDSQALWLCFALHKYNKPNAVDDTYSYLFSTVLVLNDLPAEYTAQRESQDIILSADELYYDVSRPSPPY
ncbi:hypothetical protein [Hymenobacter ruricola]|uniref:Uncharacterized protein n=1 Tax=Hymenobacter ruricola TaxID=2791023 RepID=A0ABS0I9Y9_9BACT|nr:hypothetical protein [Hymenobacter ruricola]MBF9223763.1 hypothetical protein [Hymenobacter ruricola]